MLSFYVTLFSLFAVCSSVELEEDNGVLVLKDDNFDEFINSNNFVMVEFYAPWCGHCKSLAPKYEQVAAKLKEKNSEIKIAKLDATTETKTATKYEVRGYPTLKFFKNQQPLEYSDRREIDAIINFCEKKIGSPFVVLDDVESMKKMIEKENMVLLAFLKDSDVNELATFSKIADQVNSVSFVMTKSSQLMKEYKIEKTPSAILFKKFDDHRVDFDGSFEDLTKFIQIESVPLVVEFNDQTSPIIFSSPIQKIVLIVLSKSTDYEKYTSDLTTIAKTFKGKLHFVIVDVDVEENARVLEFIGFKKEDAPHYLVLELGDDVAKYKPETPDLSVNGMTAYLEKYLNGQIQRSLMSEEVPTEQTGPVHVLVGKNYNEVCKDKSKAVFVKLYAPWCGHCKKLIPDWEKLAAEFANSKDIIIAKMDATTNEAQDLKVSGFPTLKFYPKNSDEVIDYNGERSFDALKKFVESGGSSLTPSSDKEEEEAEEEEEEEQQPKDEL